MTALEGDVETVRSVGGGSWPRGKKDDVDAARHRQERREVTILGMLLSHPKA